MSSFSFGAFPNRLDQQLMVEIASLLLLAVETDAEKEKKKIGKRSLIEQQKLVQIYLTLFIHALKRIYICPYTLFF